MALRLKKPFVEAVSEPNRGAYFDSRKLRFSKSTVNHPSRLHIAKCRRGEGREILKIHEKKPQFFGAPSICPMSIIVRNHFVKVVGPGSMVYVSTREYAVTYPHDNKVT